MLRVGEECPHYKSGYTIAEIMRTKYGQLILGPDKQAFILQESKHIDEKPENKALVFSFGSITDVEEVKVRYTLDTKGGAGGSPVLGDDYTIKAIQTFYSNKDKISGGIQISAVVEDLRRLREKYPLFFSREPVDNFILDEQ